MTVIAMRRAAIDRKSVLRDLAENRIRVSDAATLMGLGRRQVLRLTKAYRLHGPATLVSRRRGQRGSRSHRAALRTEVIALICERYVDFGPTLAPEKLSELHDLHPGRETIRQWMRAAGIWRDRRKSRARSQMI